MIFAAVILPVLGGVITVLLCLPFVSPRLPASGSAAAGAGLCLVSVLGAWFALLLGGGAVRALPVGLGLAGGSLALDPLGAWFLLGIGVCGLAVSLAASGTRWQPALLGTAMLTVLAGDAGLALIGLAGFAALCGAKRAGAAGVLVVAGALAVLALGSGNPFAAMRPVPPEGWRAGAVLVLLLAGMVALAWAGPFQRLAGGFSPASFPLGLLLLGYMPCRVLLELSGPATPPWWGVPLLLTGGVLACLGGVHALRAPSLHRVLAGLAAMQGGWLLSASGVVAVARAADLLPLATLAGGGLLLQVLTLAIVGTLACLAADAASEGAGSQILDRLGGLAAGMPVAAAAMLVAGWSLAFLPPSAGFAGAWMILQSLFAAARLGGLALHLVLAVTAVALVGSIALALAAMVRLGGVAFLGRPRTPRAAATEEAGRPVRLVMLALSGLAVVAGLLPGALVRLADPAQQWLTRAQMEGQADWLGLQPQHGAPGYAPLAVLVLAGGGLAALWAWRRRLPGFQAVPLWEDGFAAPPAWMPFGDPATQATPAILASLLPRAASPVPWPRIRLSLQAEWPAQGGSAAALLLGLAVLLILVVLLLTPS